MPITRENVTKNSLLSAVLRRGSKNMPTQEQISQELEEMYGASFDCGLDKTGDNHILKFYLESVNDKFLPQTEENMLTLITCVENQPEYRRCIQAVEKEEEPN